MAKISGGEALGKALARMSRNVAKAAKVQVGFLGDATEPNGANTAMVAAIQEYGSPKNHIPPRPFFRQMIAKDSPDWAADLGDALKANDYDAAKALALMGEAIRAELQQSIVDFTAPALSPVTVMLRGMRSQAEFSDLPFHERFSIAVDRVQQGLSDYGASKKPLVDTGAMLRSADYVVKGGDE